MSQGFTSKPPSVSAIFADYSRCEAEDLAKTGAFQSSGAVLVLDAQSQSIIGMSQNWPQVSGLMDKPWPQASMVLTDLLNFPTELTRLQSDTPMCLTPAPALLRHRKAFELQAHLKGAYLFIEWIYTPVLPSLHERTFTVACPRPETVSPRRNIYQTLQQFCEHIQEALGLDRVMVYQFDADQAGDVVAESCRPDWTPYLGLHYPASDIPQVARDLYAQVPLRHIYDAMAPLSGFLTLSEHPAATIDLTGCSLRSVSPYHLEYLQNMGVRATLSIAIIQKGKLWGLIACHHGQPLHLPLAAKQYLHEAVFQLEQCLTEGLLFREKAEQDYLERFYAAQREHLRRVSPDDGLAALEALLLGDYALEASLQADATAIYADGLIAATGNVPSAEWIQHFIQQWTQSENLEAARQDVFVSHCLHNEKWVSPSLSSETLSSENSGMLALRVCHSPPVILFAFRQEFLHEVHWGGNPHREIDAGTPLSPRRSFQLWKETVRHQARPWTPEEQKSIQTFKAVLLEHFQPQQLKQALKAGTRAFVLQVRQHSYIAKTLTKGAKSGVAMTFLESSEAPPTVLHLNQALQKLLKIPFEANASHERSVEDVLFDLGLTPEQVDHLGSIPQPIKVWSARLGHRIFKMSRCKILSFSEDQTHAAIVTFQFFDITAEERIEKSLRAAHRQVDQAHASKLKFLSRTSNEMLMPLKEIRRVSHMLHEELSQMALDDLSLYTEKINRSSQQMLNRVEQLLFFARSASGHMMLDLEPVDLQALLQNCVSSLSDFAREQGVTIQYEASRAMVVSGNRESLQHLFMNVLDNAVRYSQAGASVFCRLRQDKADGQVFVEIDDQGKGMTEHELYKAFTPYYAGNAQPQDTKTESTGFGLAFAKQIVDAHRGQLELVSSVNRGTRVRILLPRKQVKKSWIWARRITALNAPPH